MKQVRSAGETTMAYLRHDGGAGASCAFSPSRRGFSARPWHGSPLPTMPFLGTSHGIGYTAILANGTRRLKEPST